MIARISFLACLLAAAPAAAASLEPFAGDFKGSGTARVRPSEPAETTRCRIKATLSDDKKTLKQSGQCAVPGHKVDIGGTVRLNPDTGVLSGSWRDVASGRNGELSGRLDGAAMRLTMIVDNPGDNEPSSYTMTVTPTAKGYRLVTRAPGVAEPLANLDFSR